MACEKPKSIHNVNSVSLKMNIAKGFKENNCVGYVANDIHQKEMYLFV